jgi:excisionase family DNA binding protein
MWGGEFMTAGRLRDLADLPPVLTVSELRDVLRISLPKAYELAHQQAFPTVYVGRAIRIPRDSFISWLERTVGQGEPASIVTGQEVQGREADVEEVVHAG